MAAAAARKLQKEIDSISSSLTKQLLTTRRLDTLSESVGRMRSEARGSVRTADDECHCYDGGGDYDDGVLIAPSMHPPTRPPPPHLRGEVTSCSETISIIG